MRSGENVAKQPAENKSGKSFYTVSVDGVILGKKLAADRKTALDAMVAKHYPGWTIQNASVAQWKSGQYTIHNGDKALSANVSL
jgi:hypothetical protein